MEEAEEQYSMAFRSQIDTITYMTEVHNQRLNDLVKTIFNFASYFAELTGNDQHYLDPMEQLNFLIMYEPDPKWSH